MFLFLKDSWEIRGLIDRKLRKSFISKKIMISGERIHSLLTFLSICSKKKFVEVSKNFGLKISSGVWVCPYFHQVTDYQSKLGVFFYKSSSIYIRVQENPLKPSFHSVIEVTWPGPRTMKVIQWNLRKMKNKLISSLKISDNQINLEKINNWETNFAENLQTMGNI